MQWTEAGFGILAGGMSVPVVSSFWTWNVVQAVSAIKMIVNVKNVLISTFFLAHVFLW